MTIWNRGSPAEHADTAHGSLTEPMDAIAGISREAGRRVAQALELEESAEHAEQPAELGRVPDSSAPITSGIPRMLAVGALAATLGAALVSSRMIGHGAEARGSLERADEPRGSNPDPPHGAPPMKNLNTRTLSWTVASAASIAAALAETSHAQQAGAVARSEWGEWSLVRDRPDES